MSTRSEMTAAPRWRWWRIDAAGLAGLVLLTVLAYVVAMEPILEARRHYAERQAELTNRQLQATRAAGAWAQARQELNTVRQALVNSPVRLQPHTQVNARLASLTALAIQSELRVDQVQPGSVSIGRRFATLPIRITGEGNYPTVVGFIHKLHMQHDDTSVSSFVIRRQEAPGAARATFECGLTWYATPTSGPTRQEIEARKAGQPAASADVGR